MTSGFTFSVKKLFSNRSPLLFTSTSFGTNLAKKFHYKHICLYLIPQNVWSLICLSHILFVSNLSCRCFLKSTLDSLILIMTSMITGFRIIMNNRTEGVDIVLTWYVYWSSSRGRKEKWIDKKCYVLTFYISMIKPLVVLAFNTLIPNGFLIHKLPSASSRICRHLGLFPAPRLKKQNNLPWKHLYFLK